MMFVAFALGLIAAAQAIEPPAGQPAPSLAAPVTPAAPVVSAAPVQPATPAALPSFKPVSATDLANQVVCRSTIDTGSLIKKHKVCMTRHQWTYLDRENGSSARKMIENNPGGFRPQ
ncbi:hypothetical protein KZX46_09160 [Polymorphobacter sp. PAMC 29334]|uniref:hypothetical protein n=1 Tax=Polymorphobacter sp. PAMC 29334 TaxID=2862331 RepID=UPI001C793086|nr:hypothetical protein [Polymorphobacter sp. PAMC 29334]QYE36078.1 hypothetical protein KZX46_09160 [Polymorphobacter sp. PAMC 29334]